mgnify:FL=1
MKRKVALVVGAAVLCAGILAGCGSSDPVDKYLRSLDKDDSAAASQIYSEEIQKSDESEDALKVKLTERVDAIYEDFKAGNITADVAKEKLSKYKDYDPSSVYAYTTINKVSTLQKSNEAYQDAEEAENDGDLAKAITNYKKVIEDDPNYETAQAKTLQLSETYTETMKAQAQQAANAKDFDSAIDTISTLTNVVGNTDELKALSQQYAEQKNYQYVKVVCTNKGTVPKNTSKWIFSNYVTFVFELTNNSDKAIKGVQGILHISDLFGSSIMDVRCDFTGHTIQPSETYTNKDLSYDVNEFIDTDMKLYNEDYSDLIFEYEPTTIVFTDGTSVVMS